MDEEDSSEKPVDQLAKLVIGLDERAADQAGQLMVLVQAVAALVRTHPDPAAFAEAMRRAWLQSEQTPGTSEIDAALTGGIEQVLEVLEGNCSARLNIRPPGVAAEPEH